jgi:hypothetical protein
MPEGLGPRVAGLSASHGPPTGLPRSAQEPSSLRTLGRPNRYFSTEQVRLEYSPMRQCRRGSPSPRSPLENNGLSGHDCLTAMMGWSLSHSYTLGRYVPLQAILAYTICEGRDKPGSGDGWHWRIDDARRPFAIPSLVGHKVLKAHTLRLQGVGRRSHAR